MYAKINGSEAVNVQEVVMVKVLAVEVKGESGFPASRYAADFYNGQGKVIARTYFFDSEKECWKFVSEAISDGTRRDLKRFMDIELKNGEKVGE